MMMRLKSVGKLKSLIMLFTVIFVLSSAFTAFAQPATPAVKNYEANYLENRFDITIPAVVTRGDFINLLATALNLSYTGSENKFSDLGTTSKYYQSAMALYAQGMLPGGKLEPEKSLHVREAVSLAVQAARMGELAQTFPAQKVTSVLNKLNMPDSLTAGALTFEQAQEAAVAIDLGLLPRELYEDFRLNSAVEENQAALLVTKVMAVHGQYKNYIGTIVEDNIYGKLNKAILNSKKVNEESLLAVLDEGVKQGLMTGYNLRDMRNNSNFDESLTLRYGHENVIHAQQLIGLLRSEGLNAKIQLEPKTSAYVYLKEWGTTGLDPDLELVPQQDGNFIAHAKEYDLCLEFATAKQKEMCQDIILTYAKVNEPDQKGLIYQAWWQPLYTSLTEMENYRTITDNIISRGDYEAHIYSLNEQSQDLVAGLHKIDGNLQIRTQTVWANEAFYNYLKGEYK